MQNIYAYGRIMAGDEESRNRLNVIRDMQVLEENIFLDYPTREKRSRIQYNKLIKLLKEDDLLYVSSFTPSMEIPDYNKESRYRIDRYA